MTDSNSQPQAPSLSETAPVVVGVDFSEDSAEALLWAARHAESMGYTLLLLHIVHDPASQPGRYHNADTDHLEPLKDSAKREMSGFLEKLRKAHPGLRALRDVEVGYVPGLPPSRIVEVAQMLDAPLIVVGSRGITRLPHILLGSVAERVVGLASCPVVVVKTGPPPESGEEHPNGPRKPGKQDRKRLLEALRIETNSENSRDDNG